MNDKGTTMNTLNKAVLVIAFFAAGLTQAAEPIKPVSIDKNALKVNAIDYIELQLKTANNNVKPMELELSFPLVKVNKNAFKADTKLVAENRVIAE